MQMNRRQLLMPDPPNEPYATATFSKDELPVYKFLCRRFEFDDEMYRDSRRWYITPKHYVQLMVMCADFNARELEDADTLDRFSGTEVTDMVDDMMKKAAQSLSQAGLSPRVEDHVEAFTEDEFYEMANERELYAHLDE